MSASTCVTLVTAPKSTSDDRDVREIAKLPLTCIYNKSTIHARVAPPSVESLPFAAEQALVVLEIPF